MYHTFAGLGKMDMEDIEAKLRTFVQKNTGRKP